VTTIIAATVGIVIVTTATTVMTITGGAIGGTGTGITTDIIITAGIITTRPLVPHDRFAAMRTGLCPPVAAD
jgi:hypothetical protein